MSESWPTIFERRLKDGSAWTEGFTEEEVAAFSDPDHEEVRPQ